MSTARKKSMPEGGASKAPPPVAPNKFYLNGEPVTVIPAEAREKMAERLSRVVSQHFSQHPEEYEAFLAARGKRQTEPM